MIRMIQLIQKIWITHSLQPRVGLWCYISLYQFVKKQSLNTISILKLNEKTGLIPDIQPYVTHGSENIPKWKTALPSDIVFQSGCHYHLGIMT